MSNPEFTVNAYGPSSDVAAGFQPNQSILGREGNDTLIGFNPTADNPGQEQIDVLVGDLPLLPSPSLRRWSNKFNLGDWQQPYYANNGLSDYALLTDFNPETDIIQLHGSSENYRLVESAAGTEILWQQGDTSDRIAFLPAAAGLSLEGKYFQFEGNTSPTPVQPEIQQFGTSGIDGAITTSTDPFGNVYVAGGTNGALGAANAGSQDPWLAKYDSSGNQLWIRQLGSSSYDTAYGIATDKQGNSYVVGYTEGNLAGAKQAQSSDVWLAKYDTNGNQVWIQQFGTNLINLSFDIDVDDNSNVYLSGLNVKSDPNSPTGNTDDRWVAKFDTNGNRQWFSETGSSSFDESYGVAVSGDGSVFSTGWTGGDLGGENAGLYDVWISKHDNVGNLEWTRQFGTPDLEWSWGADTDSQGNVYATGWTLGNLGGQNAGSYDPWLVKYDSNGNPLWTKQFGTVGDDQAFRIHVDSQDNVFLAGYTDNNLEGTNAGSFDAWVAKYDAYGNQIWIQQFGTPKLDQALNITSDSLGSLYVTGGTEGSFGSANAGSFDPWIAKLDATSGTLQDFTGNSGSVLG